MLFNVNESVRVKLTDHGRRIHFENWRAFRQQFPLVGGEYQPPKEDENGWSEWQLWVLMQTFGKHITMSKPNPFKTTISMPDLRLEPEPLIVNRDAKP